MTITCGMTHCSVLVLIFMHSCLCAQVDGPRWLTTFISIGPTNETSLGIWVREPSLFGERPSDFRCDFPLALGSLPFQTAELLLAKPSVASNEVTNQQPLALIVARLISGDDLAARIPLSIKRTERCGTLTVYLSEALARESLLELSFGSTDDKKLVRIRLGDYVSMRPYQSLVEAASGDAIETKKQSAVFDFFLSLQDYTKAEEALKTLRQEAKSPEMQRAVGELSVRFSHLGNADVSSDER